MAKKKIKKPKLIPRRGPATNVRKAGAHDDTKRKALERLEGKDRDLDELKALGEWAYDEDD
ncbi:MAG: hypothetical protein JO263_09695 [Candidatus Eremiobacteraeota bacterium]|nr:hypothetical protein [Candidatus Eremiobacteraeota bacterium]